MTDDPKMAGYLSLEDAQQITEESSSTEEGYTGKPRYSLSINPVNLSFLSTKVDETSAAQTILLTNTGYASLSILTVEIVGDFAISGSAPTEILPGETASIQVVFTPKTKGALTGGVYIDSGNAAGKEFIRLSGSSTQGYTADFINTMMIATNTEMGTGNYIQATTEDPVPAINGKVLIAVNIVAANDATPVQIAFNNDPALTIKDATGADLAIGALAAGTRVLGYRLNNTFRLLIDQQSAAVFALLDAQTSDIATDVAEVETIYAEVQSILTYVQELANNVLELTTGLVVATTDEATEGTNNVKVMTPLRTKEAIDNTYTPAEKAKLATIEAGAEVTSAAKVQAAGAAMVANNLSDLPSKIEAIANLDLILPVELGTNVATLDLSAFDEIEVARPFAGAFVSKARYRKRADAPGHDGYYTDIAGNIFEYNDPEISVLAQVRQAHNDDIHLAVGIAFDILKVRNNGFGFINWEPRPDGLPYAVKSPLIKSVPGRWKLNVAGVWCKLGSEFMFDGAYSITRFFQISGDAPTRLGISQAWSKLFKIDPVIECRQGVRVGIWDSDFATNGWDLDVNTGTNNHGPATYTRASTNDANGWFAFKKDIDFPVPAKVGGVFGELDVTNLEADVWLNDAIGVIEGPAFFEADLLPNGVEPVNALGQTSSNQRAGGASAYGFLFTNSQITLKGINTYGINGAYMSDDSDVVEENCNFAATYNGNAGMTTGFGSWSVINPKHTGLRHMSVGSSAGRGLSDLKLVGGSLSSQKQSYNASLYAGENSCPFDTHGGANNVDVFGTEIDGGVNVSRRRLSFTGSKIICGQTNGAFLVRTDGGDRTILTMKGGEIIIPRFTKPFDADAPSTGAGNFSTTQPFEIISDDGANGRVDWEAHWEGVHIWVDDPESWGGAQDLVINFGSAVWKRIHLSGLHFHLLGTPFRRIKLGVRGDANTTITLDDIEVEGAALLIIGEAGLQDCGKVRVINSRIYNNDPDFSFPTALQVAGNTDAGSVLSSIECHHNEIESVGTTAMILTGGGAMLKNAVHDNVLNFTGVGTTLANAIDVSRNRNSTYDMFLSDLTNNKIFGRAGNTITNGVTVRDHDANPGGLGAPVAFYDLSGTIVPAGTTPASLTGKRIELASERVDPIERNHLRSFLTAANVLADVATAQNFLPAGQDEFTLEAGTQYAFEGTFNMTRTAGVTSHWTNLLFGGTATLTSISYEVETAQAADTGLALRKSRRANTAASTAVTSGSTDATETLTITIKGNVRVNAAGTFIPQFQYSTAPGGAPTIAAGSFFEMRKIGVAARTTAGNVS